MKSPFRPSTSLLAWLLASALAATAVASPSPWDEPFGGDPAEILAGAAALAEGHDDAGVVILLEDVSMSFDAEGRRTYERRLVYRIEAERSVDGWGSVFGSWKPWHQERPEIRARVITADGREHSLDPATIAEVPHYDESPDVLSDWLKLKAPLPAVAVGSVVEEQIIYRDREPLLDGGSVYQFKVGWFGLPVEQARAVLEAPAELPLRYVTELLDDIEPDREEVDGRQRWTFDFGAREPLEDIPINLPADHPRRPALHVSTGESWAELASLYSAIVERQLAASEAVLPELDGGDAMSTAQKIEALLGWLHGSVRYTGLAFAEAAVVPRPPAETLARGYGDCKDKSALLVAALRAHGIPAHLALLLTGPGRDVLPELPGMGRFDHAIVHVPASDDEPEVWIDATVAHARVGQLPTADRGRLALVARPGVGALVSTPRATSATNGERILREIHLAELGTGSVDEQTESWGAQEMTLRRVLSQVEEEQLEEVFAGVVETNYQSELGEFEMMPPDDLSRPFRFRMTATEPATVQTDYGGAELAFDLDPIVELLVAELAENDDEEDEEESDEPEPPRLAPHDLSEPYTSEHEYRIVLPAGFVATELPATGSRSLGSAVLDTVVDEDEDGVVVIRFRFDSGPARLMPEEAEATRLALDELVGEGPASARFEHVAEQHLATGRIDAALAELRRLGALHGEGAIHRLRVARALLEAGLGAAARRQARSAVELEPDSEFVHQVLGLTLARDLLGRDFSAGMDYSGAEAAWRKASELEPDNAVTRQNLAILYEHDEDGGRYTPAARLDDAVAEYRALRDDLGVTGLDQNQLIALFYAERFAEAESLAAEMAADGISRAVRIASLAVLKGADAALREAGRITDVEQRRNVLSSAGNTLLGVRRYELAAGLLTASAQGSANAAEILGRADQIRRIERYEEKRYDPLDPRGVFAGVLGGLFLQDAEGLAPLRVLVEETGGSLEDFDHEIAATRTRALSGSTMRPGAIVDFTLASFDTAVEGDGDGGMRMKLRAANVDDTWFFSVDDGALRFVAATDYTGTPPIGTEVLRRLAAGDEEGARRWLGWAREAAPARDGDDSLSGTPIAHLWSRAGRGDAAAMRLAAAGLLALGERPEDALPILEEALAAAPDDAPGRPIELAYARALAGLDRDSERVGVARRLHAADPESATAFNLLAQGLLRLGKWDEVIALSEQRLDFLPNDVPAQNARLEALERRGDLEQAAKWYRDAVEKGEGTAVYYNQLAWLALLRDRVDQQAIDDAQTAVRLTDQADPSILHTLAAVYADLGRPIEARDVLLQAIQLNGAAEPRSHDWYVLGRIAEHYGMLADAEEAYRRVEFDEELEFRRHLSTHALAERRLAALAAAETAAATVDAGS